jgi:hypothetical protein
MRSPIRRVVIVRGDKPTGVISRGTLLEYFRKREHELQENDDEVSGRIVQEVASLSACVDATLANQPQTSLLSGQA